LTTALALGFSMFPNSLLKGCDSRETQEDTKGGPQLPSHDKSTSDIGRTHFSSVHGDSSG
jgi:hypothetical protein